MTLQLEYTCTEAERKEARSLNLHRQCGSGPQWRARLIFYAFVAIIAALVYLRFNTENWKVERVHNWRVPEVNPEDVAVYGELLFAQHVAQTLGLTLMQPSVHWLPRLATRWRGREVRLMTLAELVRLRSGAFPDDIAIATCRITGITA